VPLTLLRRREVWLPTLWGTLCLLVAGVGVVAALAFHAYDLLAPHQPARGPTGDGARTLIVEGWMDPPDLQQAVAVVRAGRYARVLTTGGPIDAWYDGSGARSYAQRAAAYLRANGVTGVPVIAIEAPAALTGRTYLGALLVRDWAQHAGVTLDAVDLFSSGVHTRRSWLLYRLALGDRVEVGVFAAQPTEYDARRWWTSSEATKSTLGETLGLAWTKCCYWPERALPK
jgi:hypothetical protein